MGYGCIEVIDNSYYVKNIDIATVINDFLRKFCRIFATTTGRGALAGGGWAGDLRVPNHRTSSRECEISGGNPAGSWQRKMAREQFAPSAAPIKSYFIWPRSRVGMDRSRDSGKMGTKLLLNTSLTR